MTWNLEHGVPKMMFLFLPGIIISRCKFSIFFHSFLCIFPRYFKGESLGKSSTSINHGESMGIPRLVKPEVKRPSVMPVKAGPDRSDFHKTNLQDFRFKH